jgi:hypothetical protein
MHKQSRARTSVFTTFYSQCFHQYVSAIIAAIFRVVLLLQKYKDYKTG